MSSKNKSQLRTENSNNFPNNNTGFITPEKLRSFNGDMIDSMLISADSSSFITNPLNDNLQVNGNITASGHISASTYYGDGSNLSGVATTIDTGSFFTTGSVSDATLTFTQGDGSTVVLEVDNVSSSLEAQDLFVNVKNTSGSPISKGLAVHATGVTGENVNIELADSSNSANMPAIGILNETLADQAVGKAIISGRIKNIDTSGLVAGASVYVNGSGTLTSTKPTGSDLIQNIGICGKVNATEGEIIVEGSGRTNDLPNITEGYIWVGDSNGVPEEFSTGSIAFTNKNNTFTGTQNFNNISVSGTGSFGRIESVTGSAKIIGDAFVVVNADTPTLRYAGLQVYDSGSSSTASLEWDGDKDSWILVEEGGQSSFILTGPTGSKGSEVDLTNNKLPKAGVHRQLVNSNITDDGSTVTIGSDLNVTGTYKGFDSGSFAILNQSNTFTGGAQISSGSTGYFKSQFTAPNPNNEITNVTVSGAEIDGTSYNRVFQGFANYSNFYTPGTNLYKQYSDYFGIEYYNGFSYAYGSEFTLNGTHVMLRQRPNGGTNNDASRILFQDNGDGSSTTDIRGNSINIGTGGTNNNIDFGTGTTTTNGQLDVSGSVNFVSGNDFNCNKGAFFNSGTTFNGSVTVNAAISSSTYISASAFVGDGSQLTGIDAGIFKATGSFQATTNDLQVTGSLGVSKAIGGKNTDLTISANTASIDLTTSNTFTVTLVDSADTHLDVSTFGEDAQSVNVLVKQPSSGNTGSISFSPDFKFGQGADFLPTPALNAEDIISFTRFGNHLYGTFINNFS